MIRANPAFETSSTAVSHSLLATNTSLNILALKDTALLKLLSVVSTGILTLFVFIDEYPITTSNLPVFLLFTTVNLSTSANAPLPLTKVLINLESIFIFVSNLGIFFIAGGSGITDKSLNT